MASLVDFVSNMPKAELHVHVEGTLESSLITTLAARNGIPVPSVITNLTTTSGAFAFNDLASFLAVYYAAMTVLLTSADFFDLAWAYFSKMHSQNVIHVEMFFDPQAHTSRGVPFPAIISGLRQAIVRAERELGMSIGLIMCFLRDMSAEFAMATLTDALPYKDWIIGVGLDSDERNNPPSKFTDVFARARKEGFLITIHCDIDQLNSIEHIRQALLDIGADRLDHGTNIVEDPSLVEYVKERGIGLTTCPLSNAVTIPSFKKEEIVGLLRQGVKVTINSDDPPFFRGYMNENMLKVGNETNVTRAELIQFQRNAFEVSWISSQRRDRLLETLQSFEISSLGNGTGV